MSWAYRILALYLGFVGVILTLVITCFGHPTELEYKDYYARELKFQQLVDARRNAVELNDPITHRLAGRLLTVQIPPALRQNGVKGTIELMRPSDAGSDINIPLSLSAEGTQEIRSDLTGPFRLRVQITSNGTDYCHEASVRFR